MKKPLVKLVLPMLALPRAAKRFIALSVDLGLCILTVWLAYYLRLGEFVALSGNPLLAVAASIGIALPIFIVSGLYRAIFRYSGWPGFTGGCSSNRHLRLAVCLHLYGHRRCRCAAHRRHHSTHPFAAVRRRISRTCPSLAGRSVFEHSEACIAPQGSDLWSRHNWPSVGWSHEQQPRDASCRIFG